MVELRSAAKEAMRAGRVVHGFCQCGHSDVMQGCLNQIRFIENVSRELVALLFDAKGDLQ